MVVGCWINENKPSSYVYLKLGKTNDINSGHYILPAMAKGIACPSLGPITVQIDCWQLPEQSNMGSKAKIIQIRHLRGNTVLLFFLVYPMG
jgi:hypothetical protein